MATASDLLSELGSLLDEELQSLPEKYRRSLILCYLQERTHVEAARLLDWPSGTMSRRLARGRELLRRRLSRRGITLSGAALASFLTAQTTAAMPSVALLSATTRDGRLVACFLGPPLH